MTTNALDDNVDVQTTPTSDVHDTSFEATVGVVVPVVFALVTVVGLVGNLLVIAVALRHKTRNTTSVLIVGLAVADLVSVLPHTSVLPPCSSSTCGHVQFSQTPQCFLRVPRRRADTSSPPRHVSASSVFLVDVPTRPVLPDTSVLPPCSSSTCGHAQLPSPTSSSSSSAFLSPLPFTHFRSGRSEMSSARFVASHHFSRRH